MHAQFNLNVQSKEESLLKYQDSVIVFFNSLLILTEKNYSKFPANILVLY